MNVVLMSAVAVVVLSSPAFAAEVASTVAPATDDPAAKSTSKPKLMFIGLTAGPRVAQADADAISAALQSEVQGLDTYSVTGPSEIRMILGVERQKQLLGCSDDTQCFEEIGGALNAGRGISGDVQKAGDIFVLTASLVDLKTSKVISRAAVQGDSIKALLDKKDLRELAISLVKPDPDRPRSDAVDDPGFGGLMVGVRGDADVSGQASGFNAVAGITGEWSGKRLGLSATIIPKANPGLRLEGRFYPLRLELFRPYIGLGATGFLTGPSARAALGVTMKLGRVRLFADVAGEKFFALSSTTQMTPYAIVVGLGGGFAL